MSALLAVEPFAAIELEELVAEAELLARVDRKYVLPRRELPTLLDRLPASTRALEIDGLRDFGYRSTYFDTDDLASYRLAGQRRRRRFKVRTRDYLDTGTSWLEVKVRAARGRTAKTRIENPTPGGARITGPGAAFVDAGLAGGGVRHVTAGRLRPVLTTSYRRTTLYLSESRSRATVDVDLGWSTDAHLGARDLDRPGLAIVETKTGATPSAVDRALWSLGHRPVCISKYGVGLAALVPGLPDLKWHRVLRRDLAVPRP